jgi:predicted lipid carrier protein YhbT
MSATTEQFFDELAQRGRHPALARVTGRVRVDLVDDGPMLQRMVVIDKGAITVSEASGDADCTMRTDVALFERLANGEENAMAATLRGAITCTGDVELLLSIQKLFPGPERGSSEPGSG